MIVNYASGGMPPEYKCSHCGKGNRKLWRALRDQNDVLFCVECAAKKAGVDPNTVEEDGHSCSPFGDLATSLGDLSPAIPKEDGPGYWVGLIPKEGLEWWDRLPLGFIRDESFI